jgi:nitrate reductase gamma subunit
MFDGFLFVALPYLALVSAIAAGIYRSRRDKAALSSFSSQFLEDSGLFKGSASWHFGILIVLVAHLFALLFPRALRLLGGSPIRVWGLELGGLVFALLALTGLLALLARRLLVARIRRVTTFMDLVLELLLLATVLLGILTATRYRWGSLWYTTTAVPWMLSILALRPDASHIASLPWVAKLHFLGAFTLVALFPFGRLLHLATSRLSYLFRPYQVVIWQRRSRRGRAK